jgi:hypothetical protein
MPFNRNIREFLEQPEIDDDDWEIALQPYEEDPDRAALLGVCLTILKGHIANKPRKLNEAIGEIDRALEALYLHSHFNEIAFVLFRRMAEGDLSLAEQQMLKTLGIKV